MPLAYWPGALDATNIPRWILISAVAPFLLRDVRLNLPTGLGTAWLAWCAISLFWVVSLPDGLMKMWHFGMMAVVFCCAPKDIRPCLLWFAAGVALNVIPVGLQLAGLDWIQRSGVKPAGFFVNKNYLAEATVIAVIVCVFYRRWLLLLPLLANLAVTESRGAVVALLVLSLVVLWRNHPRWALAGLTVLVFTALWYVKTMGLDHIEIGGRYAMYLNSLYSVTWTGRGIGQFFVIYVEIANAVVPSPNSVFQFHIRPRTAHNDLITIALETGVIGVTLFIAFILSLPRRYNAPFYVVVGVLALGLFNFPLYVPTTAFIGALCAGHLATHFASGRRYGRPALLRRPDVAG